MTTNPLEETKKYVEEQNIRELFEILTAALLFHKPDEPEDFLIETLANMKAIGLEPLLTQEDIKAMFSMFDVTNRGSVSIGQAKSALRTVLGKDVQLEGDRNVPTAQLAPEKFVSTVYSALEKVTPFTKPGR